jgi:multidrug efflux system membrane fusion protein
MNYKSSDLKSESPATSLSYMKIRRIWPWLLLLGALVITGIAWRQPWKSSPVGGPKSPEPLQPGQPVSVASVTKGDIPITLSSLGTVTSLATVTVKSQLSGYLTEINFREGQTVKKGDLLARVDTRPYEATLTQYEGQREKDQALLDNSRRDLKRYKTLLHQDATSQQTLDTAEATVRQYEGTVRADQGQVDAQKLNLTYCRIVSPVDGRVGLRQVDAGNYVTASDTAGIVVVTQTNPISVVFTLPADNLRQVMQRLGTGVRLSVEAYDRTNIEKLADGVLETVDNQIDPTTGTVKLRALFNNPDAALFPNLFVNVTLHLDTQHASTVVPTAAVQTGTPGTFVYRLNADNTVSLQKVKTGPSTKGHIAILTGLTEGDRVVVDGADHLSDGAKVCIAEEAPLANVLGMATTTVLEAGR